MFPSVNEPIFNFMWYALLASVPLALWKLVEIVIWIFNHVRVDIL